MNRRAHQRSLWQVVSLYLAGSWVTLQVVDVISQNMQLPHWVFTLTLTLLAIGLPITAGTAYVQGIGRSREKTADTGSPVTGHFFTWKNVMRGGVAGLAVWGVAVTAWLMLGSSAPSSVDVVSGLEDIRRLAGEARFGEANAIARKLNDKLPSDSARKEMWSKVSRRVKLQTEPAGALVWRRDFAGPDTTWVQLGKTPVEVEHFPFGLSRVRFELPGYITRETANPSSLFASAPPFRLDEEGTLPAGMVRVSGGSARIWAPGLEQLDSLELHDFLMSKYEVTNRDYKAFVDAGGYRDAKCWRHPFVRGGRTLKFEEAVALFTDPTGRPGPSGWRAGSFPDGAADLPVGGVSWYEADAYACSVGKELPTVYHWSTAADPFSSNFVVPLSNFGGKSAARGGTYNGVSRDGVYDLAGNVREWTRNAEGENRFILGGGWSDPGYAFNDAVTFSAFDRSPSNGIRLVQYLDTLNVARASAPIKPAYRDYRIEKPVSNEVYAVYRQLYSYDHTPLNARVLKSDTADGWIRERIEMDAAYAGERLTAFLFLPRTGRKPYQAVVLFSGSDDIYKRSYADLDINFLDFVVSSGRAVLYPIYKGTYERGSNLKSDLQDQTNLYRDHVLAWSKDLSRSIDYLETRADIDAKHLGYFGISWGAAVAPIMTAVDTRFRASILVSGGLEMQSTQPMVDPFVFLPHVTVPTLMMNGKFDSFFPVESSQKPFFEHLGTPDKDKKIIITESNHFVMSFEANLAIKETLNWLDKYVGPVN